MKPMIKKFLPLIFILVLSQESFSKDILKVFVFNEEEFKKLEVRKIKKKTTYTLGSNSKGNYLRAEAHGTASGLGKELKIDLNITPYINITWKVEKDLSGIEENNKKGHDYAARVFVIKKTGATALSNRAINYVYSSNNNIGENWPSPFTKKSIDYVLSTTKEHKNEWVTVKANVKEDFKILHGLDVNDLNGVAIMTDTDNSNVKAISYYQNIYFSSE